MNKILDRKLYMDKVEQLVQDFEKNVVDSDSFIKTLEHLWCYKPVSMKLQALKCKWLLKNNNSQEVIDKFEENFSFESSYSDNIELWNQVICAYQVNGDENIATQNLYMKSRLLNDSYATKLDKELLFVRKKFVDGDESKEVVKQLELLYLHSCNVFLAFCIALYGNNIYGAGFSNIDKYMEYSNMVYLKERIEERCPFIVVAYEKDKTDYDIIIHVLSKLGIHMFLISDFIEMDEEFDLEMSAKVSLDNMQECDDCVIIPAITKCKNNDYMEDNVPYIIDKICQCNTKNDFALVVASNDTLEMLRSHKDISKRFERLSDYRASYIEDKIGFGWSGDYYEYIGFLYGEDVRCYVEREPEVKYSIVLPVRNATDTLYYTLKTCLEQDYSGDYEIVLSDNSIDGHDVAYNVYNELKCVKLRYYKTPRDLSLAKSYEYAYLHARGKYIFSLGADDGLLPWALRVLDIAWDKNCPDRKVFCWDRGFYAWPGFNGGQENQFVIPLNYKKDNIQAHINKSIDYIKHIKLNSSDSMYSLPNMYLNSGFKREYMKYLYENTGRLWDGYAQDIYMGVQNLALNEDFIYIKYPIIIAGMSSASTGAICTSSATSNDVMHEVKKLLGGKSLYKMIRTRKATLIPENGTDVSGLYISIEHLVSKNILKSNIYTENEMKYVYANLYNNLSILGEKFDKFIYEGVESVKKFDLNTIKWYEKEILQESKKKVTYFDEKDIDKMRSKKMYREGFLYNGGIIVDASRFGVTNIYEAVQLFKSFLHF